jgi:putative GTP pyrophosphokinase
MESLISLVEIDLDIDAGLDESSQNEGIEKNDDNR